MQLRVNCQHTFDSGKSPPFFLDVAFDVSVGCTALLGPSGSGKTSVLSILAGLLRPREGFVSLDGEAFSDSSKRKFVAPEFRKLGVMFQESSLFPHKNVEENLLFGRLSRREQFSQVNFDEIVDTLEIRHLLPRLPRHLSGGERQRVALGRAILSGPQMLLLDEPLASLDGVSKRKVLEYLEIVISQFQIPTLFITHSLVAARRIADQVIVLREGRVVAIGSPEETLTLDGSSGIAPLADCCPLTPSKKCY